MDRETKIGEHRVVSKMGVPRLKVANIIEDGRIAGPQRRMITVAHELEPRVSTVLVIPSADSEQMRRLCKEAEVSFVHIPIARGGRGGRVLVTFLLSFLPDVLRIRTTLLNEGVDLVHVSGGAWQFKSIIAAKLGRLPVVWHLNDTAMPAVIRWAFRLVAPIADGLIYASNRSREYYQSISPNCPMAIVPSVVDPNRFDHRKVSDESSDILSLLGDWPVVGTLASINPNKDISTFLKAFARVCETIPDSRALIVGPVYDSQKDYFRKLESQAESLGVSDRVVWAGALRDVRPMLRRIDAYLCSSSNESSPMAVWEAMFMGRAVVSSDVGDVGLHIVDGDNGYITEVGDDALMAARLTALLQDCDKRRVFGARARSAAITSFSPRIVAEKTEAFYRRILTDR